LSSISPKKKFGQNFLKNSETASQIVNFLELKNCKTILEIGPGMGALTKHILNIDDFQKIFIEVDNECCNYLENTFPLGWSERFVSVMEQLHEHDKSNIGA
jgi:16S rRNA (adenine1518-N6/adenine1519-N6)-dimethyltransferase